MMTLYHGSDVEIKSIDLSKSQIFKDFGRGFYLSPDLSQARNFAKYKADKPKSTTKAPIVTAFEVDESIFSDGTFRIKRFDAYTMEWIQFVKATQPQCTPPS